MFYLSGNICQNTIDHGVFTENIFKTAALPYILKIVYNSLMLNIIIYFFHIWNSLDFFMKISSVFFISKLKCSLDIPTSTRVCPRFLRNCSRLFYLVFGENVLPINSKLMLRLCTTWIAERGMVKLDWPSNSHVA